MTDPIGRCQDCQRPDTECIDFLVATPIWNYVMGAQKETTYTIREGLFDKTAYPRVEGYGGVVCLACFDIRARDLGIPYRESLIVFGVGCWMGYDRSLGQMPLVATSNEIDWDEQA